MKAERLFFVAMVILGLTSGFAFAKETFQKQGEDAVRFELRETGRIKVPGEVKYTEDVKAAFEVAEGRQKEHLLTGKGNLEITYINFSFPLRADIRRKVLKTLDGQLITETVSAGTNVIIWGDTYSVLFISLFWCFIVACLNRLGVLKNKKTKSIFLELIGVTITGAIAGVFLGGYLIDEDGLALSTVCGMSILMAVALIRIVVLFSQSTPDAIGVLITMISAGALAGIAYRIPHAIIIILLACPLSFLLAEIVKRIIFHFIKKRKRLSDTE